MKAIILILAIACASVKCEGESSSSSEEVSIEKISNLLKSKLNVTLVDDIGRMLNKTKQQCPDIEEKIETAAEQVASCVDAVDLGSETFCSLIRKNFATCAEPVRKVVSDCLPQESKDLPALAVKIVRSVIDQVCNSTFEEILELFNPCRFEEEFTTYESCTKIRDVFVENRNKFPTKSLLCKTLPKLRQCVKAHEDASCKNPITKQAVLQFYDAVERATNDDCQAINQTN